MQSSGQHQKISHLRAVSYRFIGVSSLTCVGADKVPAEGFDPLDGFIRPFRLPVAQVDEGGDGGGVGKGQHGVHVLAQWH